MFDIKSPFKETGDQPQAIKKLIDGLNKNIKNQCLLGVTGSGKTFTTANVINKYNKPTLILCHNKTLAAQLYSEFKYFFPNNSVEYFVSYYDYYQPEAYLPISGKYIEKDLSINKEIEKLRLSTTSTLLSGKKDVIVISSVSCIYGLGNPEIFKNKKIQLRENIVFSRVNLMNSLIESMYQRKNYHLEPGDFKVIGDCIEIFPAYTDFIYKIHFWGDSIDQIEKHNYNENTIENIDSIDIYPANIFIADNDDIILNEISRDLKEQINYFESINKSEEANRIKERTELDIEMIKDLGYCSGMENYSRYFDRRKKGEKPFCLFDYFPNDFLFIIDESHVTIPQIKGMYGGDQARKRNLVDYGFRLPSALDNRPLSFKEFENITPKTIYLSATPGDYELNMCNGIIVEQLIRPSGILDPLIELRPCTNQVNDLIDEIKKRLIYKERILITTITKKMAEKLSEYLIRNNINSAYIHSEIDTIQRIDIMNDLRSGKFDVLVGVNLLREGLDFPEVSLVIITDADKEGFLRSSRSLTQMIGRAARNTKGKAILYADKITQSIQKTLNETNRRRNKQHKYNIENNIKPRNIKKKNYLNLYDKKSEEKETLKTKNIDKKRVKSLNKKEINNEIRLSKKLMESAAKSLNFADAIFHRDNLSILQHELKNRKK